MKCVWTPPLAEAQRCSASSLVMHLKYATTIFSFYSGLPHALSITYTYKLLIFPPRNVQGHQVSSPWCAAQGLVTRSSTWIMRTTVISHSSGTLSSPSLLSYSWNQRTTCRYMCKLAFWKWGRCVVGLTYFPLFELIFPLPPLSLPSLPPLPFPPLSDYLVLLSPQIPTLSHSILSFLPPFLLLNSSSFPPPPPPPLFFLSSSLFFPIFLYRCVTDWLFWPKYSPTTRRSTIYALLWRRELKRSWRKRRRREQICTPLPSGRSLLPDLKL